jgi:homoserine acetyltransferase
MHAHAMVKSLGIDKLACLIGCSMGGMSALAYMLLHPGSVHAHISVDTAPQAQPFAIAIRSLQREAIRLDPHWNDGQYDNDLSRYRHEHRAQAWRDHLSLGDGMERTLRAHPARSGAARRSTVRL